MTSLRRFLVFQAFLLWQGGFLFYTAVVVPIGTDVLGSPLVQGLITRRVTDYLNLFGAVWAVLFIWDVAAARDPDRRRRLARWLGWAGAVVLLAALAWLHTELDALIDLERERLHDRQAFKYIHIAYLWVSTTHWAVGLVLAWLTLRAWRAADQVSSSKFQSPRSADP
jgi:hypothetical protein